jgi:hypothetical protein
MEIDNYGSAVKNNDTRGSWSSLRVDMKRKLPSDILRICQNPPRANGTMSPVTEISGF